MKELEENILEWAVERGIFAHGTCYAQQAKTEEEVAELRDAILSDDHEGIKDGIGDAVVTLIIQARLNGLTLRECVGYAYEQIKDRRGKMLEGTFVKEVHVNGNM